MKRMIKPVAGLFLVVCFCLLPILGPVLADKIPLNPEFEDPRALTAATVIYNLFATDGYMNMADGNQAQRTIGGVAGVGSAPLYFYGFIGGRAGQNTDYLKSANPATPYVAQTTANLPTGFPAPQPGGIAATEVAFRGNAQFPAPLIWAKVGDVVEIRLKNLGVTVTGVPNDPHSVHLHGTDVDAANDGVPETSVAAVPANLKTAGGAAWPGAGNVVVYMFKPTMPGTYMYHCHQEASVHVNMGMFGALVIYNATDAAANPPAGQKGGPGLGRGGNLWGFNYDKDYVMLLGDTDVHQHMSEQGVAPFTGALAHTYNPSDYHAEYWFINGISFPNTIHSDWIVPSGATTTANVLTWANWIKTHPNYDPFITGKVKGATPGQKVLVRMINMGFQTQPMHMHGFHAKVIGSDQRPWTWANTPATPIGQGEEKNTITIGSGETYELLLDFNVWTRSAGLYPSHVAPVAALTAYWSGLTSSFIGGTFSRYQPANGNRPASNTTTAFPAILDPFAPPGSYTGGPLVVGTEGTPDPAAPNSQYFPWHNHDDYKSTNYGAYPGGMFTVIRTDP